MLIRNVSQPVLACHWCQRDGTSRDATRSVKLINGTMAGICDDHLTTQWDAHQIRSVEDK